MSVKSSKPLMMVASLALAVSCSSNKDDKNTDGSATSSESEIKSLGLSGVIDVKVPDSVSGKNSTTSLNLTGTKSREACEIRDQIKQGLAQISQLGDTFCQIESFKEIEFGKKYNITLKMPEGAGDAPSGDAPSGDAPSGDGPSGDGPSAETAAGPTPPSALHTEEPSMPSMQLWVDRKSDDDITVYRCLDKKLVDVIKMRKKGDKTFGRFVTKGSFSYGNYSNTFHASASFTKDGEDNTNIIIQDKMTSKMGENNPEKSARMLVLKLKGAADGVNEVASSFSGTFGGDSLEFASIAKFGPNYGSIIQKHGDIGYKTYFDNKTLTSVEQSNYPDEFGDGRPYNLSGVKMPKKLDVNFSPDDFPADAWDCSGTQDLELKMTKETITACSEAGFEMPQQSCSGGDFGFGEKETFSDEDFQDESAFEEDLPPELKEMPPIGGEEN